MLPKKTELQETPGTGRRRAAFIFIFITVLLDMLALGMIAPVLPKLIVDLLQGDTARAAGIVGMFGTVVAFMQFLFAPALGSLSDHLGRRPVILISNFGLGLDYIIMALAPTVGWLFVGRTISGITSASVTVASAYIADVEAPEKRAESFGMLGIAFGLGFIAGPAVGGLLGNFDLRLPFWVAAGLSLANALYGMFVLPESLPREKRARFSWRNANPVGSMNLLRKQRGLLGLAVVNFLYNIGHEALPTMFVLYAIYRYGWSERTLGLALTTVGVFSAVVMGGLIKVVVTRFGERKVLMAGLLIGSLAFAMFAMAANPILFWIAIPVHVLWFLAMPAMQSLMTRCVDETQQGQLQGALGSLRGMAYTIGPTLFSLIFAYSISKKHTWQLPGSPFLLAALLMVVAAILAWPASSQVEEREKALSEV
jgi:MFS transporter, DHA1 family, tetracycline resistance protein